MYFPWVGFLEQMQLADVFVHYDDVQFSKGSFGNRVQVKTAKGPAWLTIPLRDLRLGQRIDDTIIDDRRDWRGQNRDLLRQAYFKAPFRDEMLSMADKVFAVKGNRLIDFSRASMLVLADYFGLSGQCEFVESSSLGAAGSSSQRVHDIVHCLNGKTYVTGHGAKNYLDHDLFERSGIDIAYMNYLRTPYPQLHGPFTPYVSALDLVANCGREGRQVIQGSTVHWREFIHGSD